MKRHWSNYTQFSPTLTLKHSTWDKYYATSQHDTRHLIEDTSVENQQFHGSSEQTYVTVFSINFFLEITKEKFAAPAACTVPLTVLTTLILFTSNYNLSFDHSTYYLKIFPIYLKQSQECSLLKWTFK